MRSRLGALGLLADLAEHQYGQFTCAQADRRGVDADRVDQLVAARLLEPRRRRGGPPARRGAASPPAVVRRPGRRHLVAPPRPGGVWLPGAARRQDGGRALRVPGGDLCYVT